LQTRSLPDVIVVQVAAAARKAQADILASRKDGEVQLDAKDLDVELPKAPPTPVGPGPGQPGYHGGPIPPEYLNPFPFRPLAPVHRPPYMVEGLPGVPFQAIQLHPRPEDEGQRRWREAQIQAQALVADQLRAREQQRLAHREAQAAARRAQATQVKAAARARAAIARERANAAKKAWR